MTAIENRQSKIENSREGWSRTRGWSKKVHYFRDERSLCSGSAPADGPLARDPDKVEGEICEDCREGRFGRGKNKICG